MSRRELLLSAVLLTSLSACTGSAPAASKPAVSQAGSGATRVTVAYPEGVTSYPAALRRTAPALSGPGLAGTGPVVVPAADGHPVVVLVWASWCEPCREELPSVVRMADDPAYHSVHFIGLDERDDVHAAAALVPPSLPTLVDDGTLLDRLTDWLPGAVPSTLVLDGQGRVAARVVGATTPSQLAALLRAAGA